MPVAIAKTRHLVAAAALLAAHGALAQPNGRPQVFGPSGTMYDGNNAQLSLPASGEAAESAAPAGKGIPPTDATGLGARGASSGSTQTGGEH
jgi:hypothetical protein